MRKRQALLLVVILATVVFWYSVDYRISRAHTTAVTPHEFRLFAVIFLGWGLYFFLVLDEAMRAYDKREASFIGI